MSSALGPWSWGRGGEESRGALPPPLGEPPAPPLVLDAVSGFQRRALGGGAHALVSSTLEGAGFLAAFVERTGGGSAEPFASLNVSYRLFSFRREGTTGRHLALAMRLP